MERSSASRRRRRRAWAARLAIAAALALAGSAAPARAEGVADEAELHFQLGADAYARNDYRGALEHFFLSNRLVPNRNVVFNIARTFEQMKRYADAHRQYADALAGETDPRALGDVKAALARIAPHVAVLDVTSTPPGATIYLDRKDLGSRGRAPRPLALPPGRYRVIAELDGHEPVTSEVVVAELGKVTRVALVLPRIVGTVHVDAAGAGARGAAVHVDDEQAAPVCNAPCDLQIPPGTHQLFFTREGYQGTPRQVVVTAGKTVQTSAVLSPLTGSLLVSTDERGALITIDGRAVGFTPAVIPNVPVGRQKVRVILRGYAPIEREILVEAGKQAELVAIDLAAVHEVTAVSRYAEAIEDAPSSVTVIDGRELRAFGYPTIAESLRGIRGFYLSNDRVYYSAGIRGVGQPNDYGNRVLLLSDGHATNDNLLNSSYIGSDGRVDLHDVDRIEVVRGPGSLLYGTGAFSGVINLVTRPREEPNHVRVDVGTYDNAVLHTSAGFHVNLGQNRGVWASASFARSEGVDVGVPLIKPPPGGSQVQTAHGADKFTTGSTAGRAWWGPFTVQWFYLKRDQGTPIGSYGTVLDDPRSKSVDTRMMIEARFEPQLSQSFQLMTRVHANRYFFDGTYIFPGSTNQENFAGTWVGGEARLVFSPSPRLRVTAGGEGQYHPQASMMGVGYAAGTKNNQYLGISAPYHFGAGYALLEGSPVAWFRGSAGVRVDGYSTFGPIVVPRAALIFHPAKDGSLKLMGGRAFRAPSIYEQYYNDGGETEAKAKPLLPESVYSGELEYSHRFLQDWVALAAGHASYLEHLISTAPINSKSLIVSYQNSPVPALAVGGEVEVRREWRQGWMVGATYGYQYARYLDPKMNNPRLVAAPEHLASIRAVAPLVSELASIGVRTTLEAPRRISTESNETTPTSVIVDATVSGSVSRFGVRYTLGVYNLAGWHYAWPVTENFLSRTMPQNGRTFLFDVMGTFPP
jgi:outer membrane receptor protein involved in Fe transport